MIDPTLLVFVVFVVYFVVVVVVAAGVPLDAGGAPGVGTGGLGGLENILLLVVVGMGLEAGVENWVLFGFGRDLGGRLKVRADPLDVDLLPRALDNTLVMDKTVPV